MGYDLTNSRRYKEFLSKLDTDNREDLISLLSELTLDVMKLDSKISYIEMLEEDGKLTERFLEEDLSKKRASLRWLRKVKKDQMVLVQQKIAIVNAAQKERNIKSSQMESNSFLENFLKVAKANLKEETFSNLVKLANTYGSPEQTDL